MTFLEGVISFISPCTLPLLPVYIVYLTGGRKDGAEGMKLFTRPLGFVLGFTTIFCLLGLFAGTLGMFLARWQTALNIVCGIVVILFGLAYLGAFNLNFLKGPKQGREIRSFFSAFLFGIVFSVNLTPCIGAFLGSAIMLAASSATALKGFSLLLVYSAGLGLPFLLSALLIEHLTGAIDAIKRHYAVINRVCGIFLIVVGILIACGLMNKMLAFFS